MDRRSLLWPFFVWSGCIAMILALHKPLPFRPIPPLAFDPAHLYHPYYLQIPFVVLLVLCAVAFVVSRPHWKQTLSRANWGGHEVGLITLWGATAITAGLAGVYLSAHWTDNLFYAASLSSLLVQGVLLAGALQLGFRLSLPDWRSLARSLRHAIVAYLRLLPLLFIASWINLLLLRGWGVDTPRSLSLFASADAPSQRLIFFVLIVVIAPICEELFFRAGLYRLLCEWFSSRGAAVFSGFIFSLIHQELLWVLPVWVLGYVLAREYQRSGTVAVPIFMHAAQNGLSFSLLMYLTL